MRQWGDGGVPEAGSSQRRQPPASVPEGWCPGLSLLPPQDARGGPASEGQAQEGAASGTSGSLSRTPLSSHGEHPEKRIKCRALALNAKWGAGRGGRQSLRGRGPIEVNSVGGQL